MTHLRHLSCTRLPILGPPILSAKYLWSRFGLLEFIDSGLFWAVLELFWSYFGGVLGALLATVEIEADTPLFQLGALRRRQYCGTHPEPRSADPTYGVHCGLR